MTFRKYYYIYFVLSLIIDNLFRLDKGFTRNIDKKL